MNRNTRIKELNEWKRKNFRKLQRRESLRRHRLSHIDSSSPMRQAELAAQSRKSLRAWWRKQKSERIPLWSRALDAVAEFFRFVFGRRSATR